MTHPRFRLRTMVALSALVSVATVTRGQSATVNGRLEKVGPYRLLRVWGTPEEMGFAHGYLTAGSYLAMAKEFRTWPQRRKGDVLFPKLLPIVKLSPADRAEIEGVYKGILAARGGRAPWVDGMDHPLTLDDLIIDNAYDLFRAFGCSGFTIWGAEAGDAGVITARNFDFFVPGPVSLAQQMILVREPKGKNAVATITWPGIIGAFTGINEHGVCAFVHDGSGKTSRDTKGTNRPLLLVLKEFLETARPADAQSKAQTLLKKTTPYPFSYLIRVVTPRTRNDTKGPARVFRIDATGLSENPVGVSSCITTNHYLESGFRPMEGASVWSRFRYRALSQVLKKPMTPEAAWQALRTVANPDALTLHSLVVLPEKRTLDLAFATWSEKLVAAPFSEPTHIRFDQLFHSAH